jgi:hypothetical protein
MSSCNEVLCKLASNIEYGQSHFDGCSDSRIAASCHRQCFPVGRLCQANVLTQAQQQYTETISVVPDRSDLSEIDRAGQ